MSRTRADWPFMLAVWLLLACATTTLAAGTLYADTVAVGGLRRAVASAAPADRTVLVETSARPDQVAGLDAALGPELSRTLGPGGGEVALVARSGSLTPAGVAADQASQHLTRLASYRGIEAHTSLIAGRWPVAGRDPVEATVSEGAAGALGLAAGDRLRLADDSDPTATIEVVVTGVWRPDRADAFWLGDPLELDGIQRTDAFTYRGPLVVAQDDLLRRTLSADLALEWRAIPAVDGLRVEGLEAMRQDLAGLPARLRALVPPSHSLRVTTGLPAVLEGVDRSVLVSRGGVILLTLQFAVLAAYAVLLVAGLLAERRRPEIALLRSRGASAVHVAGIAIGEAILLSVPAAAIAPLLALGIVRLFGLVGPLAEAGIVPAAVPTGSSLLVAAGAGLGCALALTLPALGSGASLAGIRAALGRPVARTLSQRLGLDLALVVVAGIALWQLRLYGAPLTRDARGALGLDPLLVAAPAFGLIAGGVLATRIVPRLGEVAERLLGDRRGLLPPLGARQLARRPLRYTRSALLLMLAAALGTFAAAYSATWSRSQSDQAAYQAASDLRVIAADYPQLPSWGVGSAYRSIPGVEAAMPVVHRAMDAGRTIRDGQLLALDPDRANAIVRVPADTGASVPPDIMAGLAATRPTTAALPLAGRPRRLEVTIDADLRAGAEGDTFGGELPADWRGIDVAVVLADADGRLARFQASAAGLFSGAAQRIEVPLAATVGGLEVVPAYPLRLQAIELVVGPPSYVSVSGGIDLTGVSESSADTGDAWTPVPFDPGAPGWSWDRTSGYVQVLPAAPRHLEIGVGPQGPITGGPDVTQPVFRLAADQGSPARIAAVASERFLDLAGARVGDTVAVTSLGQSLTVRVIGSVRAFPPLDPATPFIVVDGPTLARAGLTEIRAAEEWWLSVDPARSAAVAATLAGKPYSASGVIARSALTRSLATDPVALGVVGALALGSLAAMAFAAIGLVVSATVSIRERLGEFALLRALGLSTGQLSVWLSLEQAFLFAVGLLVGSGLGLLLAWLVLPFALLSATGEPVVPSPVLVVPWAAIAAVYGLAVGLLIATAAVVVRRMPAIQIGAVLRAGDG